MSLVFSEPPSLGLRDATGSLGTAAVGDPSADDITVNLFPDAVQRVSDEDGGHSGELDTTGLLFGMDDFHPARLRESNAPLLQSLLDLGIHFFSTDTFEPVDSDSLDTCFSVSALRKAAEVCRAQRTSVHGSGLITAEKFAAEMVIALTRQLSYQRDTNVAPVSLDPRDSSDVHSSDPKLSAASLTEGGPSLSSVDGGAWIGLDRSLRMEIDDSISVARVRVAMREWQGVFDCLNRLYLPSSSLPKSLKCLRKDPFSAHTPRLQGWMISDDVCFLRNYAAFMLCTDQSMSNLDNSLGSLSSHMNHQSSQDVWSRQQRSLRSIEESIKLRFSVAKELAGFPTSSSSDSKTGLSTESSHCNGKLLFLLGCVQKELGKAQSSRLNLLQSVCMEPGNWSAWRTLCEMSVENEKVLADSILQLRTRLDSTFDTSDQRDWIGVFVVSFVFECLLECTEQMFAGNLSLEKQVVSWASRVSKGLCFSRHHQCRFAVLLYRLRRLSHSAAVFEEMCMSSSNNGKSSSLLKSDPFSLCNMDHYYSGIVAMIGGSHSAGGLDLDSSTEGLEIYSHILFVTEQRDKLSRLAQACFKCKPRSPETMAVIGNYYALCGRHHLSLSYLQKAVTLNPRFVTGWVLAGYEMLELRNSKKALQYFMKALRICTSSMIRHCEEDLSSINADNGGGDGSRDLSDEKHSVISTDDSISSEKRSSSLPRRFDEAKENDDVNNDEVIVDMNEPRWRDHGAGLVKDYRILYGLALVYELESDFKCAIFYHKYAVTLRPNDSRLWFAMGLCYSKFGANQRALNCFRRGYSLSATEGGCGPTPYLCLYESAVIYDSMSEESKAIETYEKCVKIFLPRIFESNEKNHQSSNDEQLSEQRASLPIPDIHDQVVCDDDDLSGIIAADVTDEDTEMKSSISTIDTTNKKKKERMKIKESSTEEVMRKVMDIIGEGSDEIIVIDPLVSASQFEALIKAELYCANDRLLRNDLDVSHRLVTQVLGNNGVSSLKISIDDRQTAERILEEIRLQKTKQRKNRAREMGLSDGFQPFGHHHQSGGEDCADGSAAQSDDEIMRES